MGHKPCRSLRPPCRQPYPALLDSPVQHGGAGLVALVGISAQLQQQAQRRHRAAVGAVVQRRAAAAVGRVEVQLPAAVQRIEAVDALGNGGINQRRHAVGVGRIDVQPGSSGRMWVVLQQLLNLLGGGKEWGLGQLLDGLSVSPHLASIAAHARIAQLML